MVWDSYHVCFHWVWGLTWRRVVRSDPPALVGTVRHMVGSAAVRAVLGLRRVLRWSRKCRVLLVFVDMHFLFGANMSLA